MQGSVKSVHKGVSCCKKFSSFSHHIYNSDVHVTSRGHPNCDVIAAPVAPRIPRHVILAFCDVTVASRMVTSYIASSLGPYSADSLLSRDCDVITLRPQRPGFLSHDSDVSMTSLPRLSQRPSALYPHHVILTFL